MACQNLLYTLLLVPVRTLKHKVYFSRVIFSTNSSPHTQTNTSYYLCLFPTIFYIFCIRTALQRAGIATLSLSSEVIFEKLQSSSLLLLSSFVSCLLMFYILSHLHRRRRSRKKRLFPQKKNCYILHDKC